MASSGEVCGNVFGVDFEDEPVVGGGDPDGGTIEGDAAATIGFCVELPQDPAILITDERHTVGGLIENPEAFRRGLKSVGLGAGSVEQFFGVGGDYGGETSARGGGADREGCGQAEASEFQQVSSMESHDWGFYRTWPRMDTDEHE